MKQFGTLLLAAIVGSGITTATYEWWGRNDGVRIEHVTGTPSSQVSYRNENGLLAAPDFTATAAKATAAVVHIRSTSQGMVASRNSTPDPLQFFFGPQGPSQRGPSQSTGSGVIINAEGYIVTNNHVVDGADIVDVTLADNRSFKADVIGTDPDTDLAVIKINEKDLPYLSFINSDQTKVGEWVLAVGNPFNLNSTVTAGIISAKGRNIGIINSNNEDAQASRTAIESFIQTDAAINPGNSGGALVNLNGDLIGVNTAIASNTGSYAGYGFAVPSNIVSKIVEDLLAYGTVQRGWLGIQVGSVNGDLAREFDLSVNEGAYVSGFAEDGKSAAKEAGIKEGDVVTKLDETTIKSSTALIEYIGQRRPGDKVNVTLNRKGKTLVIPVVLKNKDGKVGTIKREEKESIATLGLNLEDIEAKDLKKLDLSSGVRVKELENGKVSRYTDMREGFIITHIDNVAVKTAKEVNEILKKKKAGETVMFSGVYEDYPREYIYALRM
jgi:serine protease Do